MSVLVKPGQVWKDNDWRMTYDRRVTIDRVDATYAYGTCSGRKTRILLSRFKPTSTGYVLVQEAAS